MDVKFILASSSPRRKSLLTEMGLRFLVAPAEIDESARPGETPYHLVRRLAVSKALAVGLRNPRAVIIGSDTVVALGMEIMGKPGREDRAREMLKRLSGQTHEVLTGVAVWSGAAQRGWARVATASVSFRELQTGEIQEYVATAEPLDKAGGYALQGRAGQWVSSLQGDPQTVIGLPTAVLAGLLRHISGSADR